MSRPLIGLPAVSPAMMPRIAVRPETFPMISMCKRFASIRAPKNMQAAGTISCSARPGLSVLRGSEPRWPLYQAAFAFLVGAA